MFRLMSGINYYFVAFIAVALTPAILTAYAKDAQVIPLADEKRVKSSTTGELSFNIPEVPKDQQVRLALDARVDWTDLAGFNPWMIVAVNGHALDAPDLLNKPVDFTTRNGVDFVWVKGKQWTVLYSPDFSEAARTLPIPWGFPDTDPYRFAWDITPYIKAGENKVSVTHLALLAQGTTLVLREVQVETGTPIKSISKGEVKPAPEGPLPTYVARQPRRVAMEVTLASGGTMRVKVGARAFEINSRTGEPEGKWVTTSEGNWRSVARGKSEGAEWAGSGYKVSRAVTVRDDHIHVADTISNASDKLVGVIYENRLDLSRYPRLEMLLGGRPIFAANQSSETPGHPSAIARWKDLTLGLFAEDDIFRVHVKAFVEGDVIGLADPRLGLPPGKSYTLEWSLYPVPEGDYYDLINAVRRNWGSNITIPGPGLFDGAMDNSKDPGYYKDFVRSRGLKLVFSGQTDLKEDEIQKYGGKDRVDLAEGPAIPLARHWCENAAEWVKKFHTADPQIKTMVYLHPSNCTEPDAEKTYADSKLLDQNGAQVTSPYRYPVYEYLSSLDNSYGKALFKTLESIFQEINPDGIFMDEISGGSVPQYAYRTQWDGCTVNIDSQTHAVTGQYSSVILLEHSWKNAMVKFLREHGKLLVGNGPASTRTMLSWKMPMFTELGSYSFLIDVHLCTPWALGNHDNENDDRIRARMVRRALDFGGVICGYGWGDHPRGFHYLQTMFPITPVELHPGMILGKERIVTNRSGRYGWPEGSDATVYVFDGDGKLVVKPQVKEIYEAGRCLTEVRMPSDHFAILVKNRRKS